MDVRSGVQVNMSESGKLARSEDLQRFPDEFDGRIDLAVCFKNEANALYRDGEYEQAGTKYRKGLMTLRTIEDPSEEEMVAINKVKVVLHLNLAAVYLAQHDDDTMFHVLKHTSAALELNGSSAKALYRRSLYWSHIEDYEKAAKDLARAVKLAPKDGKIAKECIRVRELLAEQRKRDKEMYAKFMGMAQKKLGYSGSAGGHTSLLSR